MWLHRARGEKGRRLALLLRFKNSRLRFSFAGTRIVANAGKRSRGKVEPFGSVLQGEVGEPFLEEGQRCGGRVNSTQLHYGAKDSLFLGSLFQLVPFSLGFYSSRLCRDR